MENPIDGYDPKGKGDAKGPDYSSLFEDLGKVLGNKPHVQDTNLPKCDIPKSLDGLIARLSRLSDIGEF